MTDEEFTFHVPKQDGVKTVIIIGAGPSGLMAAEILSAKGIAVHIYDRMPSPARKFLMAGRGGLNLTHSEPLEQFIARYREAAPFLRRAIEDFPPDALRNWCEGLGQETFVGSSGRIFPKSMKASPLLRAWLERLYAQGVKLYSRCDWTGWNADETLSFRMLGNTYNVAYDAALLCLGGASWPGLGADGRWKNLLEKRGVKVTPFAPSNCGFIVPWSDHIKEKFAGHAMKSVAVNFQHDSIMGDIIITEKGIESTPIYAHSGPIRKALKHNGTIHIQIDMKPAMTLTDVKKRLSSPRGKQSLSNFLQKTLRLTALQVSLIYECVDNPGILNASELAKTIKSLPILLTNTYPIDRAISSAGGIPFSEIGPDYNLLSLPGVYVAGEMLDWEAPTGGYLLQGCFSTGVAAANGILNYLRKS